LDAACFVPPGTRGFRVFAKRTSVGDRKDGAASVFSERYAKTWQARMTALQDYENFDESQWRRLAVKYQASLIVTRASHSLNFAKLYDNERFSVYRIESAGP
jgi:hypothetical protein